MRRGFFILTLVIGSALLLVFYQNAGQLSQDETPGKQLNFPRYFASIYEKNQGDGKPIDPAQHYGSLLHESPLYKSLISNVGNSNLSDAACDPKDPNQICPPNDDAKPENRPPLSLAVDPLKTLATIKMNDTWKGTIRYDSPSGPRFLLNKKLSDSSQLNFEVNNSNNSGNISIDIRW